MLLDLIVYSIRYRNIIQIIIIIFLLQNKRHSRETIRKLRKVSRIDFSDTLSSIVQGEYYYCILFIFKCILIQKCIHFKVNRN